MLSSLFGSRLSTLLIALSPWMPALGAPVQEAVDLSISLEVGVPLRVKAENKADLEFTLDPGGLELKSALKSQLKA
jgi:hypothetical protein